MSLSMSIAVQRRIISAPRGWAISAKKVGAIWIIRWVHRWDVILTRSQTLVNGADNCDFRFRYAKQQAPL